MGFVEPMWGRLRVEIAVCAIALATAAAPGALADSCTIGGEGACIDLDAEGDCEIDGSAEGESQEWHATVGTSDAHLYARSGCRTDNYDYSTNYIDAGVVVSDETLIGAGWTRWTCWGDVNPCEYYGLGGSTANQCVIWLIVAPVGFDYIELTGCNGGQPGCTGGPPQLWQCLP